ncbi:hypothetical protein MPSEU_000507000 [Mayamaea pseudoterrestris]|nr:hypothetical protein MPSEU_000507000 [Mayamaea pseudoterrestris]
MSSISSSETIYVAMTREDGKNGKLCESIEALNKHLTPVELPCIEHAHGPDFDALSETLYSPQEPWDYVVVTSPEAAKILSSAWNSTKQTPAVAAVGVATQVTLESYGIPVAFTPSKATAVFLAKEIPASTTSDTTRILYPASVRAADTLMNGLTARNMQVTRLNTYDTIQAKWTDSQQELASKCQIACFASPSAVKGWLANTQGNDACKRPLAACIGETSAKACREQGWSDAEIFYPDAPGMEAWVAAVEEAAESLRKVQQVQ